MNDRPRWSELDPVRRARMGFWLRAVGSTAPLSQLHAALRAEPRYQDLGQRWDDLDELEQREAACELEQLFREAAYQTRPYCQRCGACCQNAGPTLFPGDEALVLGGLLPRGHLITYRAGERIFCHWEGETVDLAQEQIALSAGPGGGCRLYEAGRGCAIYADRPTQCRAQRCWDTHEAAELVQQRPLGRRQLLEPRALERSILDQHDEQCAPLTLRKQCERADRAAVQRLIDRDEALRQTLVNSCRVPAAELRFWLGRPLREIARQLGSSAARVG